MFGAILAAIVGGLGSLLVTRLSLGKNAYKDYVRGVSGSGLTTAQTEQNAFTMQQQQTQQQFNAEEAAKNRAWQEEMSNTAYQRSVADMQAAGLNPAMAYGGTAISASTPSGGAASSAAPAGASGSNVFGGLLDSFLNAAFTSERLKQMQAQTRLINEQTTGTSLDNEQKGLVLSYYPQMTEAQISKLGAEVDELYSRIGLQSLQGENYSMDSALKRSQTIWQDVRNGSAGDYIAAEIDKMKSGSESDRASAAKNIADAAYQNAVNAYFAKYHSLPTNHFLLGIASAISGLLGDNGLDPHEIDGPVSGGLGIIADLIKNSKYYKRYQQNKAQSALDFDFDKVIRESGLWPNTYSTNSNSDFSLWGNGGTRGRIAYR